MTQAPDSPTPRVDYAARRRERAVQRAAQKDRRKPIIVASVLLGVIAVVCAFEIAMSYGRIHPGVSVSGIDVGKMAPAQAAAELQEKLPAKAEKPVTVTHGDQKWEVTAEQIGLSFDFDSLAGEAMAVGRTDGVWAVLSGRVDAWFGGKDIAATASANEEKLEEVVDSVAKGTDVPPVDATVEIDGTTPAVIEAANGISLQRDALKSAVLTAMLSTTRTVTAPTQTAVVEVTDDEARQAAAIVEQMLSGPVKVDFESKTWTFKPKDIAKWIAFKRSDELDDGDAVVQASDTKNITLVPVISAKKAAKTVVPAVGAKVGREAKNARFKTSNGRVTIVPSKTGIGPNMKDLAASLTSSLSSADSSRSVAMRTTVTEPEITTEKAEKMGITERISRYTTTFAAGNRSRVNNIHLLGDALDGTLIAPGKTFSFNGAVGQRTAEKGYQEANAIVNGKLVPQLGGGICQVGTTIFNAVFESGLPVTTRRNHSFYISHYPKGRDATVSWGGPDFKFRNDTDNWVLISVSYTNSSVTIALYGTDPGYEVEAETSEWRNVKKFKTEEIKDKTMAKGVRVVEDPGVEGKTITVKRIVSKDGKVKRTDSFVSVYRPKSEVVRVGTMKVEEEKPTEKTEPQDDSEQESPPQ